MNNERSLKSLVIIQCLYYNQQFIRFIKIYTIIELYIYIYIFESE